MGKAKTLGAELASSIMYGLKSKGILVGITGKHKNIILFTPPMCFTLENSRRYAHVVMSQSDKSNFISRFIKSLSAVLSELSAAQSMESMILLEPSTSGDRKRSHADNNMDDDEKEEEGKEEKDTEAKRAKLELEKYSELD